MTSLALLHFSVLGALLLAAVVTDVRERRIPNKVTVSGVVAGLLLGILMEGGFPFSALTGVVSGIVVAFPFFALGALGAGDAKLLAAVGAFVGGGGLIAVLVYGTLAGGILALADAFRRGRVVGLLANMRDLLIYWVTLGRAGRRATLEEQESHTVPYGVAIAAGAVLAWLFPIHLGGAL